jgi:hypothetical protein
VQPDDAMVNHGNELGPQLWSAPGLEAQDDWRRWVKTVSGG